MKTSHFSPMNLQKPLKNEVTEKVGFCPTRALYIDVLQTNSSIYRVLF